MAHQEVLIVAELRIDLRVENFDSRLVHRLETVRHIAEVGHTVAAVRTAVAADHTVVEVGHTTVVDAAEELLLSGSVFTTSRYLF